MDPITSSSLFQHAVSFLTGQSPLSGEMQSFWMAIQGAMVVRRGPNKEGKLAPFHAFCLSVAAGFAGGWLGFVWMGRPSAMLYNDFNFASCLLAFWLVNYTPFDLGFKLCSWLPVELVTTSWAQLFRSLGICKFADVCFEAFKEQPSPYYPIPIFGPILYATMLGNMGGFLTRGFAGYVENGMPWPFQNGFFCATFYHFYSHDTTGVIGVTLRNMIGPVVKPLGLDDKTFAVCFVGVFMQVMGTLQLPALLGPSFSPFGALLNPWKDASTWKVTAGNKWTTATTPKGAPAPTPTPEGDAVNGDAPVKSKRKRKKNKSKVKEA